MLNKLFLVTVTSLFTLTSYAATVPISGNVASKCVINTDTPGVYGNPTSNKLSTARADGGIQPIIRFDVASANAYKAIISTPVEFSSSPTLNDTLAWNGSTEVSQVSDSEMASYETDKRVFNNVTEFDLSKAGTVWFKSNSEVEYGYNKAFPGGVYKAIVSAECIAQ